MSREEIKGSINIGKVSVRRDEEWILKEEILREKAANRDGVWFCKRCSIFVSIEEETCPVCGEREK